MMNNDNDNECQNKRNNAHNDTYCQVDFILLAISAVLSNQKIMSVLTPGTHGSIFGGNPLASAIGCASATMHRLRR